MSLSLILFFCQFFHFSESLFIQIMNQAFAVHTVSFIMAKDADFKDEIFIQRFII